MTTTLAALIANRAHRTAFVIVIEGAGLAFHTSEDQSGIAAAWAGTEWAAGSATWYPSAFLPGQVKQEISMFEPKIQPGSLALRVLDRDDSLAGSVYGNNAQAARTFLTEDLSNTDTVIQVQETGGFASSGTYPLYIGNETLTVAGADKTSTGWTTSTRARWAFHTTDVGGAFAPRHRINTINGAAPKVSSSPTTWTNRKVAVWLHHYETGLGWSTKANALLFWEGVLRNVVDNGDRTLTFNAIHVTNLLTGDLFEDQFHADVQEGMAFADTETWFEVHEYIATATPAQNDYSTTFAAGNYTAAELRDALNALLVPSLTTLDYPWAIAQDADGHMTWSANTPPGVAAPVTGLSNYQMNIGLSRRAWQLLGFNFSAGKLTVRDNVQAKYQVYTSSLELSGGNGNIVYWKLSGDTTPVRYDFLHSDYDARTGVEQTVVLINTSGTFKNQPVTSAGGDVVPGVAGYLQFGDLAIVGGSYVPDPTDDTTGTFTVNQSVTDQFSQLGFSAKGGPSAHNVGLVHEGDVGQISPVQVWYEKAAVKDVILRMLLSTGTLHYNSATWDVNPAGMGVGIPCSLLDVPAFLGLGADLWTLVVTKPTEIPRLLESVLATYNRYLVWRQGKMTLVEPQVNGPTIATAYSLTKDNKAKPDDKTRIEYASDGVINRVDLKFNRDFGGTFRGIATFEDVVSQTDFGAKKAITIEAWGIQNVTEAGLPEAGKRIASIVLAYFSRPLTVVERTITKQSIQICPGDTVLLSDPYAINPKTGARGLVNWPAWVMSMTFDPVSMSGVVRLAYSGEFPTDKICPWAPSAKVDETTTNAGYIVVSGAVRYLACKVYNVDWGWYGARDEGYDSGVWNPGDAIIIRELDPADAYAPLIFHAIVDHGDAALSRLYLTAAITGWDATKQYIVTPDVLAAVQQSQKAGTFIADDVTDTTGAAANDSYVFGTPHIVGTTVPTVVTQQFVRPPRDGSVGTPGKPLAVGDLFEAYLSANSLIAYKTRHLVISQIWIKPIYTSSANRELIMGPVWVPLYAYGARALLVRLYAAGDITHPAEFTITTSKSMPGGVGGVLGTNQVVFTDPTIAQVRVYTSNWVLNWLPEQTIPCYPEQGASPPGVWLTIEAYTGSSSYSAFLQGIGVFEAAGT